WVNRRVYEGIIKPVRISGGRIDKSVAVFFRVHWLKHHAFDFSLLIIFDEHAGRAIERPHLKTRPEESAIGEKLVQTGHGVKAIDGDSILSIEAVIGPALDDSWVEEALAREHQIKTLFAELVCSPHGDGIFFICRQLNSFFERKVSPGR